MRDEVNASITGSDCGDNENADEAAIPFFPKTRNEILPDEVEKDTKPIVLNRDDDRKVGAGMNIADDSTVLVQTQDNGRAPLDQEAYFMFCMIKANVDCL